MVFKCSRHVLETIQNARILLSIGHRFKNFLGLFILGYVRDDEKGNIENTVAFLRVCVDGAQPGN